MGESGETAGAKTPPLATAGKLLALGLAALTLGAATGLFAWQSCYHQSDIAKVWGQLGMALFAVVGLFALAISALHRPTPALLAVIVPIAVVASGSYSWLVSNTAATRCPWYQEPSQSPTATTTSETTTPWTGSTTGPPPLQPATTSVPTSTTR